MFGPEDVGINIYTLLPEYMVISITGAFGINFGTETDSWYRPNTYGFSDDLTMVRGNHQWGFGASVALLRLEDELERPLAGHIQLQRQSDRALPLADFMLGRVFEFRQATPFTLDIKQKYFGALRTGHVAAVAERHAELRRALGAVVPAAAPDRARSTTSIINRLGAGDAEHGVPAGASGLSLSRRPGLPGQSGHAARVVERAAARRHRLGSERRRPHVSARGLRHEQRLHRRRVLLRCVARRRRSAWSSASSTRRFRFDDPWRAAGRTNPYPFDARRGYRFPPYSLLIEVPYDLKTTRVHSWNVGLQRQIGDNMGVSATYLGNYLMNVWGDVTGNPGIIPAGAPATGPCTLATRPRQPARRRSRTAPRRRSTCAGS